MKRLIFNILLLTVAGTALGSSNTWLLLQLRNGYNVSYQVAADMRITFTDKDFVIKSDRLEAAYSRDAVMSYKFFEDIDTNTFVNQATLMDINVKYISRDLVEISGIKSDQPVKVYSVNGTQLSPQVMRREDAVTISLSGQPNGVVIITLPNSDIPAIKVVH